MQQTQGGRSLIAYQAEDDVLSPDVAMPELKGFTQSELQRLLRSRRERDVSTPTDPPRVERTLERALTERLLDPATNLIEFDTDGPKSFRLGFGEHGAMRAANTLAKGILLQSERPQCSRTG